VRKSRGSAALGGYHQYAISSGGIAVYPRIEAVLARPSNDDILDFTRVASGATGLDTIIGEGLAHSSMTLLLGPTGSAARPRSA
jgi:circadian clock protein KaiC